MKYALGNMLNGAGGLNADQLALDLQFAADKTLTARRGPTPVLTRGSSATFVGSNGLIQSAGNNVARFDHDPVTLASRGLLIEEGRTNLLQRSEGLDVSPWFPLNTTTITSNNATAPDGATTAERFTVGGTTQSYGIFNSVTSWTSGVTYTSSFFCKADQVTRVRISTGNPATHPISAIFDLTGSGSIIGTPTGTASIERYANGWYRCAVTATSTATGLTSLRLTAVTGTTDNYPGNSVDSFLAWGAQNEVGSFATSYIPTTTSALARSADVCSITGANFTGMYNPLEGSLFTSAIFNAPVAYGVTQFLVDINDTTAANRLRYYRSTNTGRPEFVNTSNNSLNVQIAGSTALPQLVIHKYSAGFKLDDYAFYVNNSQIGTDNLGAMVVSPTTLTIGDASAGGARQYTNGTISAIRYYRKRLDNSKLASLTV